MATRRSERRLGLILLMAAATLASTLGPVGAQQLPAGAVAAGNVTRLAYLDWTERDQHHVSYWRLDGRQMATAWTWLGGANAGTYLFLSELRCPIVDGERGTCATGTNLFWEIDPTDFTLDPLLGSAEVTYGRRGNTIRWTATGDYEPIHIRRVHRKYKAGPSDLWLETGAVGIAAVARPAKVQGTIAGHDLSKIKGEAEIVLWFGAAGTGGFCLIERGGLC